MPLLFAILFILFKSVPVSGQSRYNFYTMGVEQGLSNDDIWSINQDKYGFIWIGTAYGLNRFDGHSIKKYFHSDKDKNSIAGNVIYWVFKDSDGDMWFACGASGLSRYNYTNDNFESLASYDSARKFNKYNAPIWRFGEDNRKRVYLSSGEACYRYDKRSGRFEDLTPLFKNQLVGGIGRFLMDKNNIMWIAADNGMYRYDMNVNEIRKIPFDMEKLMYGSTPIYDIEHISDHEIMATVEKAGYLIFDTRTLSFSPAESAFNPAVSHRFTTVAEILKDSQGRFWIANSADGLLEYFPSLRRSFSLKAELRYPYPYSEQEGNGKSIFEDRDGNIWYGTSTRGVVWFQPRLNFLVSYQRNYANANSLPGDVISSFLPAGKGQMYIGTSRGLSRMDVNTNTFHNYTSAKSMKAADPDPYTRGVVKQQDSLFLTTAKGLTILDLKTGQFSNFRNNPKDSFSLFDNSLWLIHYIRPGELILTGDGAARFDLNTGKCYSSLNSGTKDPLFTYSGINASYYDSSLKRLWLESAQGELYEYDVETKISIQHNYTIDTNAKSINAICPDTDGSIWIGTSYGLVQYFPKKKESRKGTSATESKMITNLVLAGHILWITTATEIIKWNKTTGRTEIFDLQNILAKSWIHARAAIIDESGKFWIGTNKGFCMVDTALFRGQDKLSPPRLLSFTVFEKEKLPALPFVQQERIILPHRENFFSFEFSAFNYRPEQPTQYAYKLEGFDKDWNTTTVNRGSYTNVPPGNYTLKLRATDGSGSWQEMTQLISIRVRPPFWLSLPFLLACAGALIAIVVVIYHQRKRQRRKIKIEKTIDYFANSVYGENSVNEICWDIARNCISQLQFEDCVVYLFDDKKNRLVQKAAYGPKNPKGHEIINPIEIDIGKGIVGTVALTGKPLLIRDTSTDDRYIVDDEPRLSELSVPILHDNKVIGVIDSEHPRKGYFTEAHLKAMTTIASISANKIAEAQAEEYARVNEIKLLEINKMLAESQLMALRAQMNPHFVFNCLNSIQECIVTQKYGEASKYLNKFSKLFRMVLNNSGKNLVTLEEEIEVLKLYLELEEMRFESSFSYEIKVEDDLENDEILIPSMLLQPYVENALWHGLMHKDGERRLQIRFSRVDEEVFRVLIDDNGIGRKRSFELKSGQSKTRRHESRGLQLSKGRLDVLEKQGYHASLEIKDKTNGTGEATGTAVIIELSDKLKN